MSDDQDRMMADPVMREIRILWGDKLIPAPRNRVAGTGLSPSLSSFLTDVGLPAECPYEWTFCHDLRPLEPVAGGTDYLLLGGQLPYEVWGVKVGVEDVWALDPTCEDSARFINSRICDFVNFLGIYVSLYAWRPGLNEMNDQDARAIVDELRARFTARDARALDEVGTWWSLVLEQAEHGLL